MTQTAVEWLAKELYEKFEMKGNGNLFDEILKKANEMFEQQIIDAWKDGAYGGGQFTTTFDNEEQYYNETFKNQLQG
jgi:hypothetical protein